MRSETALSSTKEMASKPLDTDRDQLLCAGVRWNCCDNSGNRGWMQYSKLKVEKPPKNRARLLRLNSMDPLAMAERGAGAGAETGMADGQRGQRQAMNQTWPCFGKEASLHVRIANSYRPIYIQGPTHTFKILLIWNCAICVTSSLSPKSCTSRARPSACTSASRR